MPSVSGLTPYAVTGCHPLTAFGVLVLFVYYPAFRRYRGFMLGYWLPPTEWAQISASLRLANCRFVDDWLIIQRAIYTSFCIRVLQLANGCDMVSPCRENS